MRLLIVPCLLSLAACATMTRGTTNPVQLVSDPPDALATTTLGHSCRTPCSVTVPRKEGFVVTFEKQGYETSQVSVVTEIGGAGGAALAGSVLAGGVVGVGADVATGAAYDHSPNPVSVTLREIERAPAPEPRAPRRKRAAPNS